MRHWADEALILDAFCQIPRTLPEMANHLGLGIDETRQVIYYHRRTLCHDQALIHEQVGQGHHHYLVTSDPDRILGWVRVRLRDNDTRLRTVYEVAQVAVRVTDGRTRTGRIAKRMVKHIGRLIEDIDDIVADEAMAA